MELFIKNLSCVLSSLDVWNYTEMMMSWNCGIWRKIFYDGFQVHHTEESGDSRKESFETSDSPLEVVMVKQEPEEVKSPVPEEDTRWDNSNMAEEDNTMQMEHTGSEMLPSEDDVKPEMYGAIDSPIIR